MATKKKTPPVTKAGDGYRYNIDGWIYLHIEGSAYERGKQHGILTAKEIDLILRNQKYLTYQNTGRKWEDWRYDAVKYLTPAGENYQEYMEEIRGIADGAKEQGVAVTTEDIFTWNVYTELTGYWHAPDANPLEMRLRGDRVQGHCSAFLALVPQPAGDSKIVMAHNSWDEFSNGQFFNLILDIVPEKGQRIFMQAAPGLIDSGTDFFVTGAGIMGTETTMGGFNAYQQGIAECFRIRRAMQYANNLDEYVAVMLESNTGGYANSWLFADIHTKEIMRFELGMAYHSVERKSPQTGGGNFIGFNAALDPQIRNLECSNTGYCDIRRHQGARQVRLAQLMEQYGAKLDVEAGKKILADHYDVYLQQKDGVLKENPCSRTICGHYYEDPRDFMSQPGRPMPFQARGTYDGKVIDSDMAAKMSFWARWGNSCGARFVAADFLKAHPQWNDLQGYLLDRGGQNWSQLTAGE